MSTLSEDFCRCGHVASRHADGDGPCTDCRREATWGRTRHCPAFAWAETWQLAEDVRRSA